MRKPATLAALTLTAAAALLAGCGSADDASTEASADTVEMPADSALSSVSDAPVADPSATATDAPVRQAVTAPASMTAVTCPVSGSLSTTKPLTAAARPPRWRGTA